MKKVLHIALLTAVLAAWLCPSTTHADDTQKRMIQRLPTINELIGKGVIGENNSGLLEYRKNTTEKADVVASENSDRKAVYARIAKAQGTSVKLVGQRRAAQIASKARPGTWLQKTDGNWYRK